MKKNTAAPKKPGTRTTKTHKSKTTKTSFQWQAWLHYQAEAFQLSFKRLVQTPWASLLTIAVIAIALALPCMLSLVLNNVKQASEGMNEGSQISLYLKTGIEDTEAAQIVARIKALAEIQSARYISPVDGINEFAKQAGFSDILDELPSNPLPGVVVVKPQDQLSPDRLERLYQNLAKIPEVNQARFDMLWIKRLHAFIMLGQRSAFVFSLLLCAAVILIVGNTLRLMVQKRLNEIEVMKLIGATHQFVRRPFLYAGFLYGLFGSISAYILIEILLFSLKSPVKMLAELYNTNFYLHGLGLIQAFALLIIGSILGLLSAFLSVSRQIYAIQPRD